MLLGTSGVKTGTRRTLGPQLTNSAGQHYLRGASGKLKLAIQQLATTLPPKKRMK